MKCTNIVNIFDKKVVIIFCLASLRTPLPSSFHFCANMFRKTIMKE